MKSRKAKVNGNFSEWKPFEKVDGNTFWCERKSEQFGIRDMAKFIIINNAIVTRVSKITREYILK